MSGHQTETGFIPSHLEVVAPGASPTRVALVAHGIMGSASNWRGFFRKLVEDPRAAAYRWVLVDLRHHGRSDGAPPGPDTVRSCAEDLVALTRHLGVTPTVAVGHSFGGKVVLSYGDLAPVTPERVLVLDSSLGIERPAEPGSTGDDVFRVIDGLRSLPNPIPSREALVEALTAQGFSLMLARWMTTNLEGSADMGYRFRFDLDGIGRLIGDYFTLDAWPFLERLGARAHVVRGDRSDRIPEVDAARLAGLGVPVTTLSAGHWVHVDAPDALREVIANALP